MASNLLNNSHEFWLDRIIDLFYDKSIELVIKILHLVFYDPVLIEKDLEGKNQIFRRTYILQWNYRIRSRQALKFINNDPVWFKRISEGHLGEDTNLILANQNSM